MKTIPITNTTLRNCLGNLHHQSGATDDYCRGLIVGIASAYVAEGHTLRQAITAMRSVIQEEFVAHFNRCLPESWQ